MSVLTDSVNLTEFNDMLDDSKRHARCIICTNEPGDLIGVPFIAICGRKAVNLRSWSDPLSIPPDACPECAALINDGCPIHPEADR